MRRNLVTLIIVIAAFVALLGDVAPAHADSETTVRAVNVVSLKGGIDIALPALPTDPAQIAIFDSLSLAEREAFYLKRAWLVKKLAGGIAKPGIGRAVRWTKNKVTTAIKGQPDLVESVVEFERIPDNLSEQTKIYVETGVTALVNNLWTNAADISRSTGVGITFVVGAVWNTTAGRWGIISGRALSVDIGVDFKDNRGYMNFYVDRYSKSKGGLSFDVGAMFDLLVHIGKPTSTQHEVSYSQHQKLPVIGCFRYGPNYRAWGSQLGLHVVEVAAAVVTTMGYPEAGLTALGIVRGIGFMTMYRTNLERRAFKTLEIAPDSWLLRKLGLGKMAQLFSGRSCETLFRKNSDEVVR